MNVRKPVDYSTMFAALDELMAAALPQMELYQGIGRLIGSRPEKGAAVAAAEYLRSTHSDASGFSPRNLRRMREFFRAYERTPEVLAETMTIGWTQNVVILEAELSLQDRAWYIRAVRQFGWSKLELQQKIAANAHLEIVLDFTNEMCYIEEESSIMERTANDENLLYLPQDYWTQPDGRVYHGRLGTGDQSGEVNPHLFRSHHRGNWQSGLSSGLPQVGRAWDQLRQKSDPVAYQGHIWSLRLPNWNGQHQSAKAAPYLWRRFRQQAAPTDGVHRRSRRCGRSVVYERLRHHLAGYGGGLSEIVGLHGVREHNVLINACEREVMSGKL